MTLASMFATVRQGLSIRGDPQLRADVEATSRRSDDLSLLHLIKAERRGVEKLSLTVSMLRGQVADLQQRVQKISIGAQEEIESLERRIEKLEEDS